MHLRTIIKPLPGDVVLFLSIFWFVILLTIIETAEAGGVVIVPLEEVKFEAPVIPTPLWRTNFLVMKELALPRISTFSERERESSSHFSLLPDINAVVNYEKVEGDFGLLTLDQEGEFETRANREIVYDGDIVSVYLKTVWNTPKLSFGVFILYDQLNFKKLDSNHIGFDTKRIGTILFAKYRRRVSRILDIGFTVNGNYIRNMIDNHVESEDYEDYNSYGGNVSISLEFDTKRIYRAISLKKPRISWLDFAGGIALSYQIQDDDVERKGVENNESVVVEVSDQHLIMLGLNLGMRIFDRFAITTTGIFNYDITDYKGSLHESDNKYFNIIIEGSWNFLYNITFSSGYKKVLGYKELQVDHVFVELSWKF